MDMNRFEKLAADLRGMLEPHIYHHYYHIAKERSAGSIIELGTGQGASTISLAMGIRDSGRDARLIAVDQFFQKAPGGPHPASTTLHGDEAVERNLTSFKRNLHRYGVEDIVDIYVGKTNEVNIDFTRTPCCDVLAIDVDGMIDRDLALFYDRIVSGGVIIVDDYHNGVNKRGRAALERYSRLKGQTLAGALQEFSTHDGRRILGKHLLTYRLVERFKELGLLVELEVLGSTLFCKKAGGQCFRDCVNEEDIDAIERSIVHDFVNIINNRTTKLWRARWFTGTLWRYSRKVVAAARRG